MDYPRVLVGGKEGERPEAREFVDVLVVCGQGVYANGTYFGEFHDRDVYFDHAIRFPEVAKRFNFDTVVLSGGFTQPRAPWRSEAESFLDILRDANVPVPTGTVILDECALDSAENLLLGLMTARLALGKTRIRRVGIWAAWRFKKWRFNRNAEALGIVERTYVYGLAGSGETNIQVPPEDQKQRTFDEYRQDSIEFSLLRAKDKEDKRRKRWQNNRVDASRDGSINALAEGGPRSWSRRLSDDGTPETHFDGKTCSLYRHRFAPFDVFPTVSKALKLMGNGATADEADLKSAWAREVMGD